MAITQRSTQEPKSHWQILVDFRAGCRLHSHAQPIDMIAAQRLILQRRPGKAYVHAADIFDALTGNLGTWRRATLRLHSKLTSGILAVPSREASPGVLPSAQMEVELQGVSMEYLLLPLPDAPAPASSQPIAEDLLLAGSEINQDSCSFKHWNPKQPFGLTVVTAALEILWRREPDTEWLMAEMNLPNPKEWPPESPFRVSICRSKGRRIVRCLVERNGRVAGSLHLARVPALNDS